jgi:NAD+ diphosphatase
MHDHLSRSRNNGFAADVLDRNAELRENPDWQSSALADEDSLFVPVSGDQNLFLPHESMRAWLLQRADVPAAVIVAGECIYLGHRDGRSVFALGLNDDCIAFRDSLAARGQFADLWRIGTLLNETEATILAYARGMCLWHQRHPFCSQCGAGTDTIRAGHARQCRDLSCGTLSFPRTDPAVIVLVGDRERCLLGRQARWPAGMYSTIAGFVEPGESLEQAVVREVLEETGIAISQVFYHSSQPWPFPSSIMLGFTASATGRDIKLGSELEDAQWFDRSTVEHALAEQGKLRVPPSHSIAHQLIRHWLNER